MLPETKLCCAKDLKLGDDVFIFLFLKYLFIWLHQVSVAVGGLLRCGSRAP